MNPDGVAFGEQRPSRALQRDAAPPILTLSRALRFGYVEIDPVASCFELSGELETRSPDRGNGG